MIDEHIIPTNTDIPNDRSEVAAREMRICALHRALTQNTLFLSAAKQTDTHTTSFTQRQLSSKCSCGMCLVAFSIRYCKLLLSQQLFSQHNTHHMCCAKSALPSRSHNNRKTLTRCVLLVCVCVLYKCAHIPQHKIEWDMMMLCLEEFDVFCVFCG